MNAIDLYQAQKERKAALDALQGHLFCLPDPEEVFNLLDVIKRLGGISCEEAAALMSAYWATA